MVFVWDYVNPQRKNIKKSNEWISIHFNELASIFSEDKIFKVEMYTGNNGCVKITFLVPRDNAQKVLDRIKEINRDVSLLIEYPDLKFELVK
jgi:hypothetical protein